MVRHGLRMAVLAALLFGLTNAQEKAGADEPVRIGPGMTAPRIQRKVEPEFSQEAREARVQGTVMLSVVVTETGKPSEIAVLSPLGYGLDERAQEALAKWVFIPGEKDGKPVKVYATVEVNFRSTAGSFDSKEEARRTKFNMALRELAKPRGPAQAGVKAVEAIRKLSEEKYPPAMYTAGRWLAEGEYGPKDIAAGLALLEQSAAKNFKLALYEIGIRHAMGKDMPLDLEKGLPLLRKAATLGSDQAQFHLGTRYERGDGVAADAEKARSYYRLCAVKGSPLCQFRLGRMLYQLPGRKERDYVQAMAWLQLAAEKGVEAATTMVREEAPKLTAEQRKWMDSLKRQLLRP